MINFYSITFFIIFLLCFLLFIITIYYFLWKFVIFIQNERIKLLVILQKQFRKIDAFRLTPPEIARLSIILNQSIVFDILTNHSTFIRYIALNFSVLKFLFKTP